MQDARQDQRPGPFGRGRWRRGLTGPVLAQLVRAGLVLVLAACASDHGPQPPDPAQLRAFAARGYQSVVRGDSATREFDWSSGGHALRFALTLPRGTGVVPIVLYLPGLGEPGDAGLLWRQAWAAAGYAVLSVQPLEEDASAFRSELARAGDFKGLGRQRYAGEMVAQRMQVLTDLVARAQAGAAAGERDWQRIDWSRLAVAGYDLGAYTAMALAGEQVRGAGLGARLKPRAVIALSPYANVADGAIDTRYAGIAGPVLSVTSDVDGDALGLVATVALRRAPYDRMPAPDKYLLALQGLPHARLSGRPWTLADATQGAALRTQSTDVPPDDGGSRGRGGNSGGNGRRHGNADSATPQGPRSDAEGAAAGGSSSTATELRVIAVQDITTAFLDAYAKDDPLARDWLARHAQAWLGATGELHSKQAAP